MGVDMPREDATVEELVSRIERGGLRLPEMQRRYVWRATRVRDLFDSLYRDYPSGAILIWRTDKEVPYRDAAIQQQQSLSQEVGLLLDGQQRLTSLAAVIRGKPVEVRGRKKPIELLFNLDHPERLDVVTEVLEDDADVDDDSDDENESAENEDEEVETVEADEADSTEDEIQQRLNRMTFVVANKKLERSPQWIKVTDVFKSDDDSEFFESVGVSGFNDPNYKKYSKRLAKLRAIRKYVYRMDVLERDLSYDEVTEIFVRVNSLGAKLRGSDLALAQITAKWRGSPQGDERGEKGALKTFQDFQENCAKAGFDFDLGLFVRNMVAFATGQSKFHSVSEMDLNSLQNGWKEGCDGMRFALGYLKENAKIDSPALLSSPYLLIVLGFYAHKRKYAQNLKEEKDLRRWVWCANAKGRYSRGSSETILDQDLGALRDGDGPKQLLELLKRQVGRLEVEPSDLEGRNQKSALFKTMFLAFRAAGAKDWRSQIALGPNLPGAQHRLQFHHIFPKAKLKGKYERREIDDIANLCFISGKANREIAAKSPDKYIPEIIKQNGGKQADADKAFDAQCIPLDPELLDIKNYKKFITKRRELIAARLNEFLGEAKPK